MGFATLGLQTYKIVLFDDLIAAGSLAEAKAGDRVRIEREGYVMTDGEVVDLGPANYSALVLLHG